MNNILTIISPLKWIKKIYDMKNITKWFFIISGIIHVSLIFYHIDHNKQSSLLQLYLVYRCMKLMQTQNLCFYFGFLYSYILIWFETFVQEISQAYFHLLVICFNNYVALKWLNHKAEIQVLAWIHSCIFKYQYNIFAK